MRVADPDNAKPWCGCLKVATKIKIEIEVCRLPRTGCKHEFLL